MQTGEVAEMLEQIGKVIRRSDTLVQDLAGVLALTLLLVVGLYLPGFV